MSFFVTTVHRHTDIDKIMGDHLAVVLNGVVKSIVATVIRQMNIRSILNEVMNYGDVAFYGSPHQRCMALLFISDINWNTTFHEVFNDLNLILKSCPMKSS